jgi:hypothetical protein
MPNLTDRQESQIYAIIQAAEGRIGNGAEIPEAFEWLYEELSTYLTTGVDVRICRDLRLRRTEGGSNETV